MKLEPGEALILFVTKGKEGSNSATGEKAAQYKYVIGVRKSDYDYDRSHDLVLKGHQVRDCGRGVNTRDEFLQTLSECIETVKKLDY